MMEHPSEETINGISHDAELQCTETSSPPEKTFDASAVTGQISSCGIPADSAVSSDETSAPFQPSIASPSDTSSNSTIPAMPQINPIPSIHADDYPLDDEFSKPSTLPSDPWSEQQDATSAMVSEIESFDSPYSPEAQPEDYEQERLAHSDSVEIDQEIEHYREEDELGHEIAEAIAENIIESEESKKHQEELSSQPVAQCHEKGQQKRERSPSPISLNEEPIHIMHPSPLSEDSENRATDITVGDSSGRYSPVEKAANVVPSNEEIQFRQDSISSEDYFPMDGKVAKKVISPEKRSPSPIQEIEECQPEKQDIQSLPQKSSPIEEEFFYSPTTNNTNIPTVEVPTKKEIEFKEVRFADNENIEEPAKSPPKTAELIEEQPPNETQPSEAPPPSIPEASPPKESVILRMKPKITVPQDSQDSETFQSEREIPIIFEKPPELPRPQLPPPIVKISAPAPEVTPTVYDFKPTTTSSKITESATGPVKATDSIPMIDAEEVDMRPSSSTPAAQNANLTRRERITKGLRRLCCIL